MVESTVTVFRPNDDSGVTTAISFPFILETEKEMKDMVTYTESHRTGIPLPGYPADKAVTIADSPNGLQRVLQPANPDEVLREQLEYLIEHASSMAVCGCSDCRRYHRVRSVLLEIFGSAAASTSRARQDTGNQWC